MTAFDTPPPHIPPYVIPIAFVLFGTGWLLWTISYILTARESSRSKSYGMPLLALCANVGWEIVYAGIFYAGSAPLEFLGVSSWLVVDFFLLRGTLRYAGNEWGHVPVVKRNLGMLILVGTVWFALGNWTFAKWWIWGGVNLKKGKHAMGIRGPDVPDMFLDSCVNGVIISTTSIAQLITRQHTRGTSLDIWATRALGSLIGVNVNYGWLWYMYREVNDYYFHPFAVFMWGSTIVFDLVYPFVYLSVLKVERERSKQKAKR